MYNKLQELFFNKVVDGDEGDEGNDGDDGEENDGDDREDDGEEGVDKNSEGNDILSLVNDNKYLVGILGVGLSVGLLTWAKKGE